ncbi:MAG TPA: SAM-dependent chlorinase/fluorinase [Bryobacteraceae bacterium]|nr:SAM-dependent chlorinase/fluorinase [Bryobacteraceae bacterium]
MPRPIITLTTDFGLADYFVGTMKGVILSIAPTAEIVDITHEVSAFAVTEGAFVLDQAYRYFPKKTVHVVVVDPGVGSARRPILAQAGGHSFVAPDNGLLSMVFSREKHTVREITAERYFLHPVSKTFHGRDVFAPVAAHLVGGVPPARFGKKIDNALHLTLAAPQRTGKRTWAGTILKVDHFGNIITNLAAASFPQIGERPFELRVGLEPISVLVASYDSARFGEPFAIIGSAGYLEVGLKQANAAKVLGVGAGAPVELTIL